MTSTQPGRGKSFPLPGCVYYASCTSPYLVIFPMVFWNFVSRLTVTWLARSIYLINISSTAAPFSAAISSMMGFNFSSWKDTRVFWGSKSFNTLSAYSLMRSNNFWSSGAILIILFLLRFPQSSPWAPRCVPSGYPSACHKASLSQVPSRPFQKAGRSPLPC